MNFRRNLYTLVASLVLLIACSALAMAASTKLTILHINDLHGRLDSYSVSKDQPIVGGVARIATLIKQVESSNPNTLVLSAGDSIAGTNIANLAKGLPVVEVMGKIGFNAMALGNHEFDFGADQLISLSAVADGAGMRFLAAGVMNGDGFNPFASAREVQVGDIKVAIVGITTPETSILTHPDNVKGYTFPDPVVTLRKYVGILRPGADLVIVLSHIGVEADKQLAAEVPGIDLIIGGHSHTRLDAPIMVGKTMIVQASQNGEFVGKVDLEVDAKKVVSAKASLLPVDGSVAEDATIAAIVAPYRDKISKSMEEVVGNTSVVLDGVRKNVRTGETNLGDLVADIMRAAGKADVTITNSGGIRESINVGDITANEIYTAIPFDNTTVTISLTGAGIVAALENAVSDMANQAGRFAQVSGLAYTFNASKPVGQRIVSVTVGGAPIDLTKTYTVAVNDFMAAGGDGYTMMKDAPKVLSDSRYLREVATTYLKTAGTIAPAVEGRITEVK